MAKKTALLLFVAALLVFTLSPVDERRFDLVLQQVPDPERAQALSEPEREPSAALPSLSSPTPEPTPIPTPIPTPTPRPTPEPTPLVKGMQNDDVTVLQNRLTELGFLSEMVDGVFGNDTATAINDAKQFLNDLYLAESTPPSEGEMLQPPYPLDGRAEAAFVEILHDDKFNEGMQLVDEGSESSWIKRIQVRLNGLGYLYNGVDGALGENTVTALKYFQKVNGLAQTGIGDANTIAVLFSSRALVSDKPLHEYKVVVDISEQRVYVYQWDPNKENYSKLVKKFRCSTGTKSNPTPLGTFDETVRRGALWHHFKDFGNCWAQYAIHIDPTGNVMFHSVLYTRKNGKRPTSSSLSALGRRASHGCIRLAVPNAKWLHENITDGTTVVIQK